MGKLTGFEDFIDAYHAELAGEVMRRLPPRYALDGKEYEQKAAFLARRLFLAQFHAAAALATHLRDEGSALLVGEASVGKTITSIAVAKFLDASRVLVVCPAHLIGKWKREILSTIPHARVAEIRRISDVDRLPLSSASPLRPAWFILSRDVAKLGSPWRPAVRPVYLRKSGLDRIMPQPLPISDAAARRTDLLRDEQGNPIPGYTCPECGRLLAEFSKETETGTCTILRLWNAADLQERKSCPSCGKAVWQYERPRTGRPLYPVARYLARKYPRIFDLLIVDECHQYKARGSAQGMALGDLARTARRTLAITATLMSGKASSVFYLLHRISPSFRSSWSYSQCGAFVRAYGLIENSRETYEEIVLSNTGKQTKQQRIRTTTRELPGVSPAILRWVLDRTVFMRLSDLGIALPPYREHAVEVPMTPEQKAEYSAFLASLEHAIEREYRGRRIRLLGSYLQALLSWPDAPWRGDTLVDPDTGDILASVPALSAEMVYPKEQAIVDLCLREKARGRKVLIFCTHTKTRDITRRLQEILTGAGVAAGILPASVSPRTREEWIRRKVGELDALITSPRLVGEGLDLIEFPTVIWAEPEYSTYVVRQASRRTWRITQKQPVDIYFMVYADTIQAQALALVAGGIRAASMVDGEVLPEDTLASDLSIGRADFFLRLARAVIEKTKTDDLSDLLSRVADAQQASDEFIGVPGIHVPAQVPAPRTREISVTRTRIEQLSLF